MARISSLHSMAADMRCQDNARRERLRLRVTSRHAPVASSTLEPIPAADMLSVASVASGLPQRKKNEQKNERFPCGRQWRHEGTAGPSDNPLRQSTSACHQRLGFSGVLGDSVSLT